MTSCDILRKHAGGLFVVFRLVRAQHCMPDGSLYCRHGECLRMVARAREALKRRSQGEDPGGVTLALVQEG